MLKRLRKIRLKYRFSNEADFDLIEGRHFAATWRVTLEYRLPFKELGWEGIE